MRPRAVIVNALRRSGRERGLRIATPSVSLSSGHMRKADHNLVVMTDLGRLLHEDWVVVTAYYAMYQSALALLARIGLESKDHAITVAILEYFFGSQFGIELLRRYGELKEKIETMTIEEKYINSFWRVKTARENVMSSARDFVSKVKIAISELDERLVGAIVKEVNKLRRSAKSFI